MNEKNKKPGPNRRDRRVVGRLLAAVEKTIEAADQARKARDELMRLAAKNGGDGDNEK
ncbi:MAG: hypothetical protein GX594_00015 [Pirellulaceae bacterium]|nr:hypothetical protein [Pirellulaceae bacterium]